MAAGPSTPGCAPLPLQGLEMLHRGISFLVTTPAPGLGTGSALQFRVYSFTHNTPSRQFLRPSRESHRTKPTIPFVPKVSSEGSPCTAWIQTHHSNHRCSLENPRNSYTTWVSTQFTKISKTFSSFSVISNLFWSCICRPCSSIHYL